MWLAGPRSQGPRKGLPQEVQHWERARDAGVLSGQPGPLGPAHHLPCSGCPLDTLQPGPLVHRGSGQHLAPPGDPLSLLGQPWARAAMGMGNHRTWAATGHGHPWARAAIHTSSHGTQAAHPCAMSQVPWTAGPASFDLRKLGLRSHTFPAFGDRCKAETSALHPSHRDPAGVSPVPATFLSLCCAPGTRPGCIRAAQPEKLAVALGAGAPC